MKWVKGIAVVVGAVVITAFGIDATDTLRGSKSTLLGQLIATDATACPDGMVAVAAGITFSCIDQFEVSAGGDCLYAHPATSNETQQNLQMQTCSGRSEPGVLPWRHVTRDQASAICARREARLPAASEWYVVAQALINSDQECNVGSRELRETGEYENCRTPSGVSDMVGNVWEWVSGDVIAGQYKNRALPEEGYVSEVDSEGIAVATTETPGELFAGDYFWSDNTGTYGIMKGGFYGSQRDAGIYTSHMQTKASFSGTAVGFRCVQ
ncbi:MAG: SUMF1/EgtB/PvdO family nonheme iron enzyme [Patescibacteria group bacterium]